MLQTNVPDLPFRHRASNPRKRRRQFTWMKSSYSLWNWLEILVECARCNWHFLHWLCHYSQLVTPFCRGVKTNQLVSLCFFRCCSNAPCQLTYASVSSNYDDLPKESTNASAICPTLSRCLPNFLLCGHGSAFISMQGGIHIFFGGRRCLLGGRLLTPLQTTALPLCALVKTVTHGSIDDGKLPGIIDFADCYVFQDLPDQRGFWWITRNEFMESDMKRESKHSIYWQNWPYRIVWFYFFFPTKTTTDLLLCVHWRVHQSWSTSGTRMRLGQPLSAGSSFSNGHPC